MRNLAELLVERSEQLPGVQVGLADDPIELGRLVVLAGGLAEALAGLGLVPGARVALIGPSSTSWLVAWAGIQMGGMEGALVNPAYPDELLAEMLTQLGPHAVIWVDRAPVATGDGDGPRPAIDGTGLREGRLALDGRTLDLVAPGRSCAGVARRGSDIAGYMHTSGTTGPPKFCAQSHDYFLRLGRFCADTFALTARDTVLVPLPFHHINPLGYGVIGGLVGHARFVGLRRFSATEFWPTVRKVGATVAILHHPPVEILKRRTTRADAADHSLRMVFFADEDFLDRFDVPMGISAYGSTEAGGLCHTWTWRRGEHCAEPEGMSKYAGRPRHDVRWMVADDGEILVKGTRPGVLFSGYWDGAATVGATDSDGWFRTGDLGRVDDGGNLVFIGRRSEAIRVKGEYVPISYVEERFAGLPGVEDLALWRRDGPLGDDEVVLFVVAAEIPKDPIAKVAVWLPPFMRPAAVALVPVIQRDTAVGKIRRAELSLDAATAVWELYPS